MSAQDPRPPGSLELAIDLFDELYEIVLHHLEGCDGLPTATLGELERRRAALQPRKGRRRENQAKSRGCSGCGLPLRDGRWCDNDACPAHICSEGAPRRENQAKPRGDKP